MNKLLVVGGPLLLLGTAYLGWSAFLRTDWSPLALDITNTEWKEGRSKAGPCWSIDAFLPRTLYRGGKEVLRVEPPLWSDIRVIEMPSGRAIPLNQSGSLEIGDVACTSEHSQKWIDVNTGREAARVCDTTEWTTCREAGGPD